MVRTAVIPAAGRGTRFGHATRIVPKVLLPVGIEPLIDLTIQEAVSAGIEKIVVVVPLESFQRDIIIAHLTSRWQSVDIVCASQVKPLGLGDAVAASELYLRNEPFAVLLPDEVFAEPHPTADLLHAHQLAPDAAAIVALHEVALPDVRRFGVAACDAEPDSVGLRRISGLVEKPDPTRTPSRLAVVGRYVLDSRIYDALRETPMGVGGEIQLTDALHRLAQRGLVRGRIARGQRFDAGTPEAWIDTNATLGRKLLAQRIGE